MEYNEKEWNIMIWDGMEYNGMEWNGMKWMKWNGMGCMDEVFSVVCLFLLTLPTNCIYSCDTDTSTPPFCSSGGYAE